MLSRNLTNRMIFEQNLGCVDGWMRLEPSTRHFEIKSVIRLIFANLFFILGIFYNIKVVTRGNM